MKLLASNAELLAKLTIVSIDQHNTWYATQNSVLTCMLSIDALFPWSVHTGIAALLVLLHGVFTITCLLEKLLTE
jgi:hypothetical protein